MDLIWDPQVDRGEKKKKKKKKRERKKKKKKTEINNSRTRAGKVEAYEEYSHARKIAKKSMNLLATETEAPHQGNLRELYSTIKKQSGKFEKRERPAKDKGGKPFPNEEDQKKRWMEHFGWSTKQASSTGPARYPISQWWPTSRLWSTHQEGNIPGHQTVEEWQASRTRQYPSRGIENGYRNQCRATVHSLQEDLGRRTSTIRMEGRPPHEAAKQGWRRVTSAPVSIIEDYYYCPSQVRCSVECYWTGWNTQLTPQLREQQAGFHRGPSCNIAHYPKTAMQMELPSLHQLF